MDGVLDVLGGVVGNPAGEAGGKLLLDERHLGADPLHDIQRVGVRQRPDAHEHRLGAAKPDLRLVILRAEHHVRHVAQPDQVVAGLADDEVAELLERAQVGIGAEVHLHQRAFGAADGGEEVVGGQRVANLGGVDVQRRHAVGLEPDAHGKGAAAQDVRPLHALRARRAGAGRCGRGNR